MYLRHALLPLLAVLLLQCCCCLAVIDFSQCGSSLGCFRVPDTCASEAACDRAVVWKANAQDPNILDLQLSTKDPWVAVAFSDNDEMGDDTTIACTQDSTQASNINIKYYWLTGKVAPVDLNPAAPAGALTNTSGSLVGGVLSCSMSRPLNSSHAQILDLTNKQYFLLLASGPMSGNALSYHGSGKSSTESKISLTSVTSAGAAGVDFKLKLHGIVMVLAWVTFAGIGLMSARYYKSTLTTDSCLKEKMWFTFHRGCMVTVFCLTVIGFIVIFVHVKGFSKFQIWPVAALRPHPILGVIVTALAVINPIGALFRPHPGDSKRIYFNWIHWAIGTLAHILGVITVFMGVNLNEKLSPSWLTWIMVAYVAVHALCEIILEIHKCQSTRGVPGEDMQMKGGDNTGNFGQATAGENHSLKKAILGIYIFIVLALGIVMAVVIGLD